VHRNKTRTGWLGGAPAVNPGEVGGHNLPAANFERLACRLWSVVNRVGFRRGHRGATRVGTATRRRRTVEMNCSATPFENADSTSARGPYNAPKTVAFVDALPRSATGKILKQQPRDLEWAGQATRIHG
jgi:acyl-CoA synthetase (AMP-forming)/AMP-acid ligase II